MGFLDDLRLGLRGLTRNPSIAAVALLSLALGIGANTTVFTLLNAVLLHPLPVREPSRLAAFYTLDDRGPGFPLCSYPNYRDYRDRNTTFSSVLLYAIVTVSQTGRVEPRMLVAQIVSSNYFSTLGVNPVVGHSFVPEEDLPGAAPTVVISDQLWASQFARDPQVISRSIDLNGRPYQIAGVAPRGFHGLSELAAADVWAPLSMYPQLHPMAKLVEQRRALLFSVIGRLKPEVSRTQAEADLDAVTRQLRLEYPMDNEGRRIRLTPVADLVFPSRTRDLLTNGGVLLMIMSCLVLMTACGNLASLLLARAAARNKEIAVRLALGASRWRLVRQLLAESTVLALLGGAAGLVFAAWARNLLWSMRPPSLKYSGFQLDLDLRVLGFTFVASVLTGFLFGLVPAIRATRPDLGRDLKERTGQSAAPGRRLFFVRPLSLLVVGQVALSLIALIGASLFVRSISQAFRIDTGFAHQQLGMVVFNVADQGYSEARGRDLHQRALDLARSTPGVTAAALSKDVPFHVSSARTVVIDSHENTVSGKGRTTLTSVVTPEFFRTMGIPVLHGRDFDSRDAPGAPRAAIVNESAAAWFWPGDNPIGKRIHFTGDAQPVEVVGMVRNANYQALGETPQPLIYLSLVQNYFPQSALYLRTNGDPETIAGNVRHVLQTLDHNLYLQSEALSRTIREELWAQRLSAGLLAVFGVLALSLAMVGIYGVISYTVSLRVREIGVRMALGATPAEVQLMLLREGLVLIGTGVVLGTAVALAGSRVAGSLLFAVSPRDPFTFIAVPLVLALTTLTACWLPATRATRVDPAAALRHE